MRLIDADEFKAVIGTPIDGDGPVRYAARTVIEAVIRALNREPTICCERCRYVDGCQQDILIDPELNGEWDIASLTACSNFKERPA